MSPPRAAYVHIPFCRHHCGYCNFTVLAGRDDLIEAYLVAIERELGLLGTPQPVSTLYLGGGTPTHLAADQLERLLHLVTKWLPPEKAAPREFTVEANPEDLDVAKAELLVSHGVNRVSLGVQSFNAQKRLRLERSHSDAQIQSTVRMIHGMRADLNLDLIFAAPGESLSAWMADLDKAIELAPDHVSTYGLTYEKGTTFWNRRLHGELMEIDEELQREMYLGAIDRLSQAGFEHYEVSNFARPGHRSRHNQVYWRGEPYLGFGPGAARYVDGIRETNHRSTATWLHRIEQGLPATAEREQLDDTSRARERLVLGLRMIEGISRSQFAQATGHSIEELAGPAIERFCSLGMLEDWDGRLRLTRQGLLVSDSLWPELL
jgi:oxygen-independent coproporphyrinogen-3 oxidase